MMIKDKYALEPNKNKNKDMLVIKILIPLMILLIAVNLIMGEYDIGFNNNSDYKTVNVLVYSGTGTSENCVNQIIKCMGQSNSQNLITGVKFKYNTSSKIDNNVLDGYDVVVMPGSSEGYDYINNGDINVSDLKNFIASGKGFIGICAGAYSGAEYTDNWYYGWGLAPNVVNEPYLETGNVTIDITSAGNEILDSTKVTISHINGPAMSTSGSGVITFATYSNNSNYYGYAAIVGDHYGEGRTVLSGVHPELSPQHTEMLVDLILWAYNGTDENKVTNTDA